MINIKNIFSIYFINCFPYFVLILLIIILADGCTKIYAIGPYIQCEIKLYVKDEITNVPIKNARAFLKITDRNTEDWYYIEADSECLTDINGYCSLNERVLRYAYYYDLYITDITTKDSYKYKVEVYHQKYFAKSHQEEFHTRNEFNDVCSGELTIYLSSD